MYVFFFQDQHTLPKWNILWQLLFWFVRMEFPFRPAHPLNVKYSLKAVIMACSYGVFFQDQHTLLKWNIFSKLLLWLALSAHIQRPFRTSTPSQREIFSLKAVIVACSLCSNTLPFQDQHTLPKRNIFSGCYCGLLSLLIYSGLSGPAHPPKEKYSLTAIIVACFCGVSSHTLPKRNILPQLLLWFVRMEFPVRTSTPSQSERYFIKTVIVACSLCSYTVVFRLIKLSQILWKLIPEFNFKMSAVFFL